MCKIGIIIFRYLSILLEIKQLDVCVYVFKMSFIIIYRGSVYGGGEGRKTA